MSTRTLQLDRMMKLSAKAKKMQADEHTALIDRAIKYIGKPEQRQPLTPQGEISLLEKYVEELNDLEAETLQKYPNRDDNRDAVRWVRIEREKAIETITRKKLGLIDPDLT